MTCTICLLPIEENQFDCERCSLISHLQCMLDWNKVLRKTERPTYFTCPVCKIGMNMSIFNPRSGMHIYKHSRLGKALTRRLNKVKNPMYILNRRTNRIVKRFTKLGKLLVYEEELRSNKRIKL